MSTIPKHHSNASCQKNFIANTRNLSVNQWNPVAISQPTLETLKLPIAGVKMAAFWKWRRWTCRGILNLHFFLLGACSKGGCCCCCCCCCRCRCCCRCCCRCSCSCSCPCPCPCFCLCSCFCYCFVIVLIFDLVLLLLVIASVHGWVHSIGSLFALNGLEGTHSGHNLTQLNSTQLYEHVVQVM